MTHKNRYQLSEHSAAVLNEALRSVSVGVRDLVAAELQIAYAEGLLEGSRRSCDRLEQFAQRIMLEQANRSS